MEAPSAVGWTVKERLLMFWKHKRPLVICVASIIVIGLLIVVLFIIAEVKTFYAKISGESPQSTQVTTVYTIVAGPNGTSNPNEANYNAPPTQPSSIASANSTNQTSTNPAP